MNNQFKGLSEEYIHTTETDALFNYEKFNNRGTVYTKKIFITSNFKNKLPALVKVDTVRLKD